MAHPIFQVDAFTHIPYSGNPAAVVILKKMQPDKWLQQVAAEMNLSETAFVAPNVDPFKRVWQLRWFTPQAEVRLCGHGTLAAAHVMYSEGYAKPLESIRFETLSGELEASKDSGGWIELDFPTACPEPADPPADLGDILGATPVSVNQVVFEDGVEHLVELESAEAVLNLAPDIAGIKRLGSNILTVTAQAAADAHGAPDFVSRVFAPNLGINEDPVTGSIHCYLSTFWGEKLGKREMKAHQVSKRGGTLKVTLDRKRTKIAGRAVMVLKGSLLK